MFWKFSLTWYTKSCYKYNSVANMLRIDCLQLLHGYTWYCTVLQYEYEVHVNLPEISIFLPLWFWLPRGSAAYDVTAVLVYWSKYTHEYGTRTSTITPGKPPASIASIGSVSPLVLTRSYTTRSTRDRSITASVCCNSNRESLQRWASTKKIDLTTRGVCLCVFFFQMLMITLMYE